MPEIIGIDQGQLARIEQVSRELKQINTRESIRVIGEVANRFDAAIDKVLSHIDDVAQFAGLDPEETRRVRQGLETLDGSMEQVKGILPFALQQGGVAGLGLAAGAALVGALNGSSREAARRTIEAAKLRDEEKFKPVLSRIEQRVEENAARHAERRAAFRRARKPR